MGPRWWIIVGLVPPRSENSAVQGAEVNSYRKIKKGKYGATYPRNPEQGPNPRYRKMISTASKSEERPRSPRFRRRSHAPAHGIGAGILRDGGNRSAVPTARRDRRLARHIQDSDAAAWRPRSEDYRTERNRTLILATAGRRDILAGLDSIERLRYRSPAWSCSAGQTTSRCLSGTGSRRRQRHVIAPVPTL